MNIEGITAETKRNITHIVIRPSAFGVNKHLHHGITFFIRYKSIDKIAWMMLNKYSHNHKNYITVI